jgi:tetratricopeptide (TPR) repeat protein
LWETIFKDGQRLLREGKHEQALKEFKAALNISDKFAKTDPRRSQSLNGLAIAHTVRQEFADAEPLFQQAVELIQKTQGEDDLELARVLKHLALVLSNQHKYEPAEQAYQKALKLYERLAPSHPDAETIKQQLGRVQKRLQDAKRRKENDEILVVVRSKPSAQEAEEKKSTSSTGQSPQPATVAGDPPSGSSAVRQAAADAAAGVPFNSAATENNLVGRMLDDRYQVLERVASGGMSVIYKAHHALLDRMVAIKVMHPHLVSNTRNVRRFTQEAKTACGLTHPNICAVREFGVTKEGLCYIVMDFVDGETLAARINRDHHLSSESFTPICKQIVDALTYAHASNVLHRDLKPSNIMLQQQAGKDFAKLVDFGIAKAMAPTDGEESLSLTQTGETVGSPLYMSPEQCRGIPVDHRSDIYSLGCLMYKSLTGFPPFLGGSDIDVYFKHINEEPQSFSAAAPDVHVPEALEAIVLQALQKNPNYRQQSMEQIRSQLEEV